MLVGSGYQRVVPKWQCLEAEFHDLTHHRLVVVFQGHSDHIEADDESDEDVQIVAGADRVDKEAYVAVSSVVRQALRLFSGERDKGRVRKKSKERERDG